MLEAILRQRQPGAGDRSHVGITYQRQNWVVKRGSGNLHATAPGRRGMRWQYLTQQHTLFVYDESLILEGVVVSLRYQLRDIGFFQEEFVKPRDLREDLQIGEILRAKIPVGALGRVSSAAKAFPKFAVTRIAADHLPELSRRLASTLPGETGPGLSRQHSPAIA